MLLLLLAVAGCSADPSGAAGEDPASATASADPDAVTDAVQTDPPAGDVSIALTFVEVAADGRTVDASAVVTGLVEAGGSCSLAVEGIPQGPVTGPPNAAEPGPTTVECGRLSAQLGAGTDLSGATVTATYVSPTTEVVSEPVDLVAP